MIFGQVFKNKIYESQPRQNFYYDVDNVFVRRTFTMPSEHLHVHVVFVLNVSHAHHD